MESGEYGQASQAQGTTGPAFEPIDEACVHALEQHAGAASTYSRTVPPVPSFSAGHFFPSWVPIHSTQRSAFIAPPVYSPSCGRGLHR